ncbi:MAG: OsmC family protein [Deltaproteobacteria bacterium]|nr:MAG: OsmC family protein [Deltaproteobacteria bacterium]
MVGTFGGALEARKIDASQGRLAADAEGEVEVEDGVLVIKRIHVKMRLKAGEEQRATAERVHGFYADKCPVYRSLKGSIAITTELVLEQ